MIAVNQMTHKLAWLWLMTQSRQNLSFKWESRFCSFHESYKIKILLSVEEV
jgi:hypothetical protein